MSQPIDVKEVEAKLRAAREEYSLIVEEQNRSFHAKVYKEEFRRLIFQDLGRQAGALYLRQLQHGKDCA